MQTSLSQRLAFYGSTASNFIKQILLICLWPFPHKQSLSLSFPPSSPLSPPPFVCLSQWHLKCKTQAIGLNEITLPVLCAASLLQQFFIDNLKELINRTSIEFVTSCWVLQGLLASHQQVTGTGSSPHLTPTVAELVFYTRGGQRLTKGKYSICLTYLSIVHIVLILSIYIRFQRWPVLPRPPINSVLGLH